MTTSPTARRVQEELHRRGFDCTVIELSTPTRTAKEAAQAVGCGVEQIVKSLIFRATDSNSPILVVASGSNRVNEARISQLVGEPIAKADATFVRERTGFVIGGVAPIGHKEPIRTFIDEDLLQYSEIWAAAGTPTSIFKLTPHDLQTMTDGQVVTIK
ncbi:prolyl-tRNA editing enzyme YbaK/EbsC (Cys-tRNA(Pro) deacylase) [Thermosporothrix hazakensis]|jgi:prolyl-tRNA editing enzyme YbaK/EbsC (Cys-tRNA(Pro) deacylase)|uniref:Prolyl-tRNA editing enzyme YbaK/EbsC (Cys-tRNA(Pro) deacylase) n=2 Tax=Thermosporothrix TaxID=768650 RepID=A0A326U8S9_THEHA|nr:YbaK/EbsC family protein [Thermosporothrix hazakensis]PZW32096.1 prolyl-tRNA editing enzyme YbaK/EbsC (Cys-tRNA(Pro) deacylase) [Thermosporothrix hazakensis]BBH91430.1 prolyl-tRNA editing protein [Thermosporothrix sp. COM3]GCE49576.1 prolyl-tRNA editing protein [Thermosporothrix hazakensis]